MFKKLINSHFIIKVGKLVLEIDAKYSCVIYVKGRNPSYVICYKKTSTKTKRLICGKTNIIFDTELR